MGRKGREWGREREPAVRCLFTLLHITWDDMTPCSVTLPLTFFTLVSKSSEEENTTFPFTG